MPRAPPAARAQPAPRAAWATAVGCDSGPGCRGHGQRGRGCGSGVDPGCGSGGGRLSGCAGDRGCAACAHGCGSASAGHATCCVTAASVPPYPAQEVQSTVDLGLEQSWAGRRERNDFRFGKATAAGRHPQHAGRPQQPPPPHTWPAKHTSLPLTSAGRGGASSTGGRASYLQAAGWNACLTTSTTCVSSTEAAAARNQAW